MYDLTLTEEKRKDYYFIYGLEEIYMGYGIEEVVIGLLLIGATAIVVFSRDGINKEESRKAVEEAKQLEEK